MSNSMVVEDYILKKCIGKGSFGEVYYTVKEGTGEEFATKKMSKELVLQEKVKKYFNNEIFILKNVNHKNIIKLYDIKQTTNNFYLVTEYCNGGSLNSTLETYIKTNGKPFSQEIVQHLMRQIVDALYYLHTGKILHRDLKLDNILLKYSKEEDKNNLMKAEVKIIDFGFARYLEKNNLAQSLLGSPINMDPKILEKMKKVKNGNGNSFGYDEKADIWSLGTLCYEMLIGSPAFNATSYDELLSKLDKGDFKIPSKCTLSLEAISFLNSMLKYDSKMRSDISELKRHKFLTGNVKDFKPVNLEKLESINLKDNNNNIILNIKENQSIWSLFKSKIDMNKVSNEGMVDSSEDATNNSNSDHQLTGRDIDYIDSMSRQFAGLNIKKRNTKKIGEENVNTERNNLNNFMDTIKRQPSKAIKNKMLDPATKDLILNSFSEMNKDFLVVQTSLLPFVPDKFPLVTGNLVKFEEENY